MKKLLTLICAFMATTATVFAVAPEIVDGKLTVYDGTATNNYLPIYGYYLDNYCRSQYIIPEADLVNLNGKTVYGLRYYSSRTDSHTYKLTAQVYLKVVASTEFDPVAFAAKETEDIVYTGNLELLVNGKTGKAEMVIAFDKPFTYTGGNLLIGVDNTTTTTFSRTYFYGTEVAYNAGVYGQNSSSLDAVTATEQTFIPKTTFFLMENVKVQVVIELIDAIGSPITLESEPAIVAARKAYDALDEEQKALVTNYDKLTDAEAELLALKDVTAPHDLKVKITPETATVSWQGAFDTYDYRLAKEPATHSFGFEADLEDWTSIDNDGDGNGWVVLSSSSGYATHNDSKGCVASASYYGGPLTPDNWLVSPQITLGGIMTFWAAGQDINDFAEHFAVYVSTNSNDNLSDFTLVSPEFIIDEGRTHKQFTVDLSKYSGEGYVAIRHFNCTDQYWLDIDDIEITEPVEWNIDQTGWTSKSATINLADLETHTEYYFQVRGHLGEKISDWVETSFVTPNSSEDDEAIAIVEAYINAIGTVTLEREAAIVAARTLFDALQPKLQEQVSNYSILLAAEKTLASLKNNIPWITDGWVHYDNGELQTTYSAGGDEKWCIRIPAGSFTGKYLTKVGMYITDFPGNYTVHIYSGSFAPEGGTKVHEEVVNMPNADAFNEATLATPVEIDPTEDVWVIFINSENYDYTMTACNRSGVSNGDYFYYEDGWTHLSEHDIDAVWMIRAFFEQSIVSEVIDLIDAIGSPITLESEPAIVAARTAYDALDDAQKPLVTNYKKLTDAEADLLALKDVTAPHDLNVVVAPDHVQIFWQGAFDSYDLRLVKKPATRSFGFEADLEGWTSIDADEDGNGWIGGPGFISHNDSKGNAASASYDKAPLTPDNWLVSPKVTLGGSMTFWAAAQHYYYYEEHFAVYVSTNSNDNLSDFTLVSPEFIIDEGKTYKQFTVDLSKYSGEGYVAIRHFNCTDQFWLLIDDIEITGPMAAWDIEITGWSYTDAAWNTSEFESATEYIFQVRGHKGEKISEWVETSFVTPNSSEDDDAIAAVEALINAIGSPVTLASEPAIVAAREAFDALKPTLQEHVSNYEVLLMAEEMLASLKNNIPWITDGWVHYDDGVIGNYLGAGGDEKWGIRIPANTAPGNLLTKVGMYIYTAPGDYTVTIYSGGATPDYGAELYTEVVNMPNADAFNEVTLATPVEIDPTKDVWVIFNNTENYSNPMTVCARSGVSNGDYLYYEGGWTHLSVYDIYAVWMIRAFFGDEAVNAVIDKINAIGVVEYTPESKALIDDARSAYNALSEEQKTRVTNYETLTDAEAAYAYLKELAEAKAALEVLVKEATDLKTYAEKYDPSVVSVIEAIIANAESTLTDPAATVIDVINKTDITRTELSAIELPLLEQAKYLEKQAIIALFQEGIDYPAWYASVIVPALDLVDAIVWDDAKTVAENFTFIEASFTKIYNDAKEALEALRAGDTRAIVSTCEFTGFANAIRVGMKWNESARKDVVDNLNASAAAEPYRIIAEECILGKWDETLEKVVDIDIFAEEVLTAGDYQFFISFTIDGAEGLSYRFPRIAEGTLTLTVDATPWEVDVPTIYVDADFSSAYAMSPLFTVSKGEGIEDVTNDKSQMTNKVIKDGQIYILRGDHLFDAQGKMVK